MIGRAALVLALAHMAMHSGTSLKIEVLEVTDLEDACVALHVKLHNVVSGLKRQFSNNNGELRKTPVLPLLVTFQWGLEHTLSDTVDMKDKRAALVELRSADTSVERLIASYKTWEASHRSYKLSNDSGILLEVAKTATSLERQVSKMNKFFQAKKRRHEKRLKALRILANASATKSNKDALQREEKLLNKLSEKRVKQFAKMSAAVDAVSNKDPKFLFAFLRAVHDATVDDDLHATAVQ